MSRYDPLQAIWARAQGIWDDPDLTQYGALHTDPMEDVRLIAARAIQERHAKQPENVAAALDGQPLAYLIERAIARAERARSYGKLMVSSKDTCIDDVLRLLRAALPKVQTKPCGWPDARDLTPEA